MENIPTVSAELISCFDYVFGRKFELYNDFQTYAEKADILLDHLENEIWFRSSELKWEFFNVAVKYTYYALKDVNIQRPARNKLEQNILDCREMFVVLKKTSSLTEIRLMLELEEMLQRNLNGFNVAYYLFMIRDHHVLTPLSPIDFIQKTNIDFARLGILVPLRIVEVTYDENSDIERNFAQQKLFHSTSHGFFMIGTEHLNSVIYYGLEPYMRSISRYPLHFSTTPINVKITAKGQVNSQFNYRAMAVCEYIQDSKRITQFTPYGFWINAQNANIVKVKYMFFYYEKMHYEMNINNDYPSYFEEFMWPLLFVVGLLILLRVLLPHQFYKIFPF